MFTFGHRSQEEVKNMQEFAVTNIIYTTPPPPLILK